MIYLDGCAIVKLIHPEDGPAALTAWLADHTTSLRSLDAIHVATAEMLLASGKRISEFVTYDKRMAVAANAAGFRVVAPS